MSFSPVPDYLFDRITQVTPGFLKRCGVTLLLLDLDNTLIPYGSHDASDEIVAWIEDMKSSGIELFIVSNTHTDRAKNFSEVFHIGFIKGAGKPSVRGIKLALQKTGKTIGETALAGDQSYTDVLASNRAGIISIVVQPIRLKNPLLAVRYVFEIPFRAMCKNKMSR